MNIVKGKILSSNKGASVLEFALSSTLLFTFLILGFDILRLAYHTSTLQYVLGKGASKGVIKASSLRDDDGKIKSESERLQAIKNTIKELGDQFLVDVKLDTTDANIAVCTNINTRCLLGAESPGEAKQFVRVDLSKKFFFIFGQVEYPINIHVIVKNEPF